MDCLVFSIIFGHKTNIRLSCFAYSISDALMLFFFFFTSNMFCVLHSLRNPDEYCFDNVISLAHILQLVFHCQLHRGSYSITNLMWNKKIKWQSRAKTKKKNCFTLFTYCDCMTQNIAVQQIKAKKQFNSFISFFLKHRQTHSHIYCSHEYAIFCFIRKINLTCDSRNIKSSFVFENGCIDCLCKYSVQSAHNTIKILIYNLMVNNKKTKKKNFYHGCVCFTLERWCRLSTTFPNLLSRL